MKGCAFQYATGNRNILILEDTNLITREEAEVLWEKYIPIFKKHMEEDKEPEMVIWIDMKRDDDYHTTTKHWRASDFVIRDGKMFSIVSVA